MIVALSIVFTIGGVEVTSLASMARVTCFMSSLTGMFGWNPIPFASRQGRQSPRVAFRCSSACLPTDFPSMEFLWAWLEVGLNKKVEMTLFALMQVGQRSLRLICVLTPGSCSTRGGPGPFAGQPSNLGLSILDRAARAPEPFRVC